jgi:uncharacterized protein (DUF488 family)
MSSEIYTIGHSTQLVDRVIDHLKRHGVTAIADVRSTPYSRHNPQFSKEELHAALSAECIHYVFLGKELGARSDDECCYVDDKVQYERLSRTESFRAGIARVVEGSRTHRIALMCAEKDPLDCHRTILVARELVGRGCRVRHILIDGSTESHDEAMERLVKRLGMDGVDMFRTHDRVIAEAYEKQGGIIAYDRKAHRAAMAAAAPHFVNEGGGS